MTCRESIYGRPLCKFEARYDTSKPAAYELEGGSSAGFVAILEASKAKTYVRDVCVACGKTVERNAP